MNHLKPQIKLYITIAIAIIIFSGISIGVVLPLIKKINSQVSRYTETKQQIVDIEKKRSQIAATEKEYEAIKDSILQIDSALTDQANFLDALMKLEKLAEDTGNKHEISVIDQSKKDVSTLKSLSFRITLRGPFANIMNFINNFENAQFYGKIEKIEMAKEDRVVNQILVEEVKAVMEIKIYTK